MATITETGKALSPRAAKGAYIYAVPEKGTAASPRLAGDVTPADGWNVFVDWDNNGSFSNANEAITGKTLSLTIDRGFAGLQDRVAKVGRCSIVVDNSDQSFSPLLAASVLPRRGVMVTHVYNGIQTTLFRGFLEKIEPQADAFGLRLARLDAVDALALLQLHELAVGLLQNYRADETVAAIVANCYTPPGTAYDTDPDVYPYSADRWSEDVLYDTRRQRALPALRDVCNSSWGRFYIRRDGAATYESRHHRILDTTVRAVFAGTMTDVNYSKAVGTVYNEVEVTAHPRNIGVDNEVLWAFEGQAPAIQPGETKTFRASFRDPDNKDFRVGGLSVVQPVAYTDYIGKSEQGGGGLDRTGSLTVTATVYANSADIVVTNGHTLVVYLTSEAYGGQGFLQIRGLAVRIYEPPKFIKTDSTSQAAYQKRAFTVNAVLQDKPGEAEVQAQYLLDRYKDPLDDVGGVQFVAGTSATQRGYARDLEIGDRVTLTEAQLGISSVDYFINAIRHEVSAGGDLHVITLAVEKNEDQADAPFILDVSLLDTGVLVY